MKILTLFLVFFSFKLMALCENQRRPEVLAKFDNSRLLENSGMDISRQHKNVFWSLNDANNEAVLFAIGLDGKTKGEFQVSGSENIDWEDIAVASCMHDRKKDCLYVADTGNNKLKRKNFSIYVIEEPSSFSSNNLEVTSKITFTTSGKFNFESFSVNEKNHDFYLISKDEGENKKTYSAFFVLARGTDKLVEVAKLNFKDFHLPLGAKDTIVTSGDFDSASETVLIGTYGKAFEIKLSEIASFSKKASIIPIPAMEKAEAIFYHTLSGQNMVVTSSEGESQPLYAITCSP